MKLFRFQLWTHYISERMFFQSLKFNFLLALIILAFNLADNVFFEIHDKGVKLLQLLSNFVDLNSIFILPLGFSQFVINQLFTTTEIRSEHSFCQLWSEISESALVKNSLDTVSLRY